MSLVYKTGSHQHFKVDNIRKEYKTVNIINIYTWTDRGARANSGCGSCHKIFFSFFWGGESERFHFVVVLILFFLAVADGDSNFFEC